MSKIAAAPQMKAALDCVLRSGTGHWLKAMKRLEVIGRHLFVDETRRSSARCPPAARERGTCRNRFEADFRQPCGALIRPSRLRPWFSRIAGRFRVVRRVACSAPSPGRGNFLRLLLDAESRSLRARMVRFGFPVLGESCASW